MKRLILALVVISVTALGLSTGIGATLIKQLDQKMALRSLETRINSSMTELKESRHTIQKQIHALRSKAGQEEALLTRSQEERAKLDSACRRMAAKLNESTSSTSLAWGAHNLDVSQAKRLLEDWGKSVDELDQKIQAAQKKVESYRIATTKLDGDQHRFTESITKLEVKLNELLNAREVLTVQRQVSEILAAASGRDVPGETAELMTALQEENDRLRGEISAYGFSGVNDALIGPEDDLDQRTASSILQRYGVRADRDGLTHKSD